MSMWVRVLGQRGNATGVVLPPVALRALGWKKGDYLMIDAVDETALTIRRFTPTHVPDRVVRSLKNKPPIAYDR